MNKAVLAGVAAALVVSACSSSGGPGNSTGTPAPSNSAGGSALSGSITVLAAASLTDTFTIIAKQFKAAHPGVSVTFSFGASSDLATQIQQGNPADVFASASTKTMDQIGGSAVKATNFATNTMEIATPPGNPKHIKTVADLAKSGVKVAVCDYAVPCGTVAQQVFDNANVTVKPTASEQDVTSTLTVVESGEVDAGVVYVTDVKTAGSKVTGVPIPAAVNATTTYPISVVKGAKNPALAQSFVGYVLSAAGLKVLRDAAFAPAA
jgi:molybdate transport system substrate-binding protein